MYKAASPTNSLRPVTKAAHNFHNTNHTNTNKVSQFDIYATV